MDGNFSSRKTPPEDEEWEKLWPILDLTHRSRFFLKPLVAFKENVVAWAVAVVVILYLNSPSIIAALQALLTGWKG